MIAGQPKFVVQTPQLPHLFVISLGGLCWVKSRGQGRWEIMTHGSLYVRVFCIAFIVSLML